MPEIPGPPSDYSDAERQAWFSGAATVASILTDQCGFIAEAYAECAGDGPDSDDDTDAEDGDECPDCGADVVGGMGGVAVCPQCGYTDSGSDSSD